MVCNLMEDSSGSLGVRCLQCFGRKRRGGDATRELACIYADPLFIGHAKLLVASVEHSLSGTSCGEFIVETAKFLGLWAQMAGHELEKLVHDKAWSLLGETMVAACSHITDGCDRGALVGGIDVVLKLAGRAKEFGPQPPANLQEGSQSGNVKGQQPS